MITYLLLRNNKESGPYSLHELQQFGLKPYDLVWVNGKSAAWRYPGEIEELKAFAPMVEEQPFDRFFKKPSEEKKEDQFQPKEESAIPKTSFVPKKSVFVTMPGQKTFIPKTDTPEPVVKKVSPVPVEQTISITENPVAAEIKYSQPLDEIKEMYVRTLQERKQKIANKVFIMRNLKKVAVVLVIIAASVLIGYSLKYNLPGRPEPVAQNNNVTQPLVAQSLPETAPVEPAAEQPEEITMEKTKENAAPAHETPVLTEERPTEEKMSTRKTVAEKPVLPAAPKKEISQPVKKEITADESFPGVELNSKTGERTRKVRTNDEPVLEEVTEKKQLVSEPKAVMKSNELTKLVSVKSNDYQVVAFGGIRNLQLTVYNDSKFILDNVTVELQYLKPSEQPLRTEQVQFRSVSPGGTMTIRLPDTNRGIKVLYKITNILSTQSAKETAGL